MQRLQWAGSKLHSDGLAVWTWAAVACAWVALSWPVIVEEDAWADFSMANLFCSLRNSWTLELNSSAKDPEGENA